MRISPTPHENTFEHPAFFYRGAAEYVAGIAPFIWGGLASGDPVAVAVPETKLGILTDALGAARERVRWFDMTEMGRNPGWIIPGVLRSFADRHRGRHVRIVGEPIWPGRSTTEYPACAQHEALINLAFAGRAVTILCPYDAHGLDTAVLDDAAATHPVLMDSGGTRSSEHFAPKRITAAYNRPLSPAPPAAATFRFDANRLAQARDFIAEHASGFGLPAERVNDVVLATNELVSNSIVHASGSGTLLLWADSGHVICEVQDDGHLADPLAGRLPAPPEQRGGRGLLLVNHLADLVRMHATTAGNVVRAHFSRAPG